MNMEKVKQVWKKIFSYNLAKIFLLALGINFIVECFSRKSIFKAFGFAFSSPLIFLYGVLIIATTLTVALLFRRRLFAYILISALWIIASFVNFIILNARVTPFNFADLMLIKDALAIWHLYYSKFKMALIVIAIVVVVVGLIVMWFKLPKIEYSISRLTYGIMLASMALALGIVTQIGIMTKGLDVSFGNIATGYLENGFAYSFSSTMFNSSIRKPSGYSSDTINGIANQLAGVNTDDETIKPNILFVQLESFMDPYELKGVELSENPIPYFTHLYDKYSSGYLSVPSVGAGTANTEVEILLGMNMLDFGTGVYPYKTIFNKTVVESVAFNLKNLGYGTFALHNNVGDFYSRYQVMANFGFDVFVPLECMTDVEYNPTDWAKDEVLIDYILQCMDSTSGVDYGVVLTVQAHGAYPTNLENLDIDITVSNFRDEENTNALTYYVNQIAETDRFVEQLIKAVEKRNEETVIVFYGDHIPNFNITEEELVTGDPFKTKYVVWDNIGLKKEDKDVEAFQIAAEILDRLGIHEGTLVKYHQNFSQTPEYLDNLRQLEYDMIRGSHFIYNEEFPFEATDIQYGIDEFEMDFYSVLDEGIVIYGDGFNEFCKVVINEEEYETRYENHILYVDKCKLKTGDVIKVVQGDGQVEYRTTRQITVE